MGGIVCAIRGGLDSRPTVVQAIALARTTGLPLHSLYVVNLDFLSRTSTICVRTMREIYRHLSNAADQGDEAANVISDIVVKM